MTFLSLVSFAKDVNAQGCNQNGIGDVKCAPTAPIMSSGTPLSFSGVPSGLPANSPLAIAGSGTPLSFPASTFLPTTNEVDELFGTMRQAVEAMDGMQCGGVTIDESFSSLAQNMVMEHVFSGGDATSAAAAACQQIADSGLQPDPNEKGETSDVDVDSEAAKKIAECAHDELGVSTAVPKGDEAPWYSSTTGGGNKGCALAVSRILNCSGYSVGTHVSTIALDKALDSDPCYEEVDANYIESGDAMGLQPGDILMTPTAGKTGHTGVYVGNGKVISNSSGSYQGSKPGTVQQNYTITEWNGVSKNDDGSGGCTGKGVICRNPGGSAVYRRKDGC